MRWVFVYFCHHLLCFDSQINLRDWEIKEFTPRLSAFSQGKYLATEAGDPSPCCVVQAYQGVFLCQKNQCLFTGTTLTFQRTGMAHRGMGAGTIQFYWIWNLFPSSFFLYFFILTEEYLWFLIKPQDTQVCLGWFLQGSFHFIFTLLPFFLFLKNA